MDIIAYTVHEWGQSLATKYVGRIDAVIKRLADQPQLVARFEHQGRTYMRKRAGSHSIFARVESDSLVVVRILHQHMDQDRPLN